MTRRNDPFTLLFTFALLTLPPLTGACGDDPSGSGDSTSDTGEEASTETGGDGDGDGDANLLKVAGSYTDEWGSEHAISDTEWTHAGARYAISQFDNAAEWAIAQNDADNEFDPGKWSRFDFTFVGNTLYYCQTAFAAESEADALSTAPADASDPTTSGCGGAFAWTRLGEDLLELRGDYEDEFMSQHQISPELWSVDGSAYAITQFDSAQDFAIASNPADGFAPGKWSRFDWMYVDNALYYCQGVFDADDEATALASPRPDDSDPANGGCGGSFAWSRLQ